MPFSFHRLKHTIIRLPLWSLIAVLVFTLFSSGMLIYHYLFEDSDTHITSKNSSNGISIFIDAGHGGEDPGKVGINNALEKDINLSISLKLQSMLENKGFTVYLTRTKDSAPSSKKEDMKERMNKINEIKPSLIVSIHQNSFTDSSVKGPQVFYYSESDVGKEFAQIMQDEINEYISPSKPRVPQANNNYYLLKESPSPIIIVECGFLSNPEESDLLITDNYQQKIARGIYFGILAYTNTDVPEETSSDE